MLNPFVESYISSHTDLTSHQGAPIYISEIAPPNLRGTLLVLESVSIVGGVVISYWITYGTRHLQSEASFRLPFGLQMVSATILGTAIHFFPFSPRWLALVGRNEDSLASITKLRGLPASDHRVQAEYHGILTEVTVHHRIQEKRHPGVRGVKLEIAQWLDLARVWRRTILACAFSFFQQFMGINAFIYVRNYHISIPSYDDLQKLLLTLVIAVCAYTFRVPRTRH